MHANLAIYSLGFILVIFNFLDSTHKRNQMTYLSKNILKEISAHQRKYYLGKTNLYLKKMTAKICYLDQLETLGLRMEGSHFPGDFVVANNMLLQAKPEKLAILHNDLTVDDGKTHSIHVT